MHPRLAEARAPLAVVVIDREERDEVVADAAQLEIEQAALQVVLSAIAAAAASAPHVAPWG
ncbi:MAG: hypothetical protein JWM98_2648 [Thermoleophilia bacterium]|nr:hypothetical protein [Thermoleophilia bacterium]